MKTIAFVPVRCNSKSIPMKNIKDFCGRPLIYWALQALQDASQVDEIYVATDCDEIATSAKSFGFGKVRIYYRDAENAQDHSSTESVMLEFIDKYSFADTDIFVLVQATCPLVQTNDFQSALTSYKQRKPDSILSCARIMHLLWDSSGIPLNYDFRNRPRRQDFSGSFMENGAFYINKVGNIIKYQNRLSGDIMIYEMPEFTAIDIDEPEDWTLAEGLMNKHILHLTK